MLRPGATSGRHSDAPADIDPLRVRSLKEAAKAANISVPTLRRLIRAGQGPKTIHLSERRLGVRDRDFFAWLESRRAVS
jgi:predicted DNA-binding transcriptional regulator AlpA